jgi:hypothetical protein
MSRITSFRVHHLRLSPSRNYGYVLTIQISRSILSLFYKRESIDYLYQGAIAIRAVSPARAGFILPSAALHWRYWSSPRSRLNLFSNLYTGLHHQGTRRLGGIAQPRYLVRRLWHLKFYTLALSPTSCRLYSAFLWLGQTTLALPTAFSIAFGCFSKLFSDTLRSCILKVLIAYNFSLS